MLLIKNGVIYINHKLIKRDILCHGNLIIKIHENIIPENFNFIDASNLIITPGFIDLHTHLREPGFEYKENILSGTRAAVAGGFTCVCAMANLNPVPDCIKNLELEKKIIKSSACCDVLPFMSITKNKLGKKLIRFNNIKNLCIGVSDDGDGLEKNIMREAIKQAYKNNILISSHCEDKKFIKPGACVHDGVFAKKNNLIGISSESEYKYIARDLKLLEKYNARYHICHVSTRESINLIKRAQEKKLRVTCEATPHHLVLCDEDIKTNDGCYKMSPPLRSRDDRKALIKALKNNIINAIATDHAPHSFQEKNSGLTKSLMGISGLETAFAVLHTELVTHKIISFEKLIYLLTHGPSKIINISCEIKPGAKANLVLLNIKHNWQINSKNFFSKGKSTPFDNKKVIGKVIYTIINGKIIYQA